MLAEIGTDTSDICCWLCLRHSHTPLLWRRSQHWFAVVSDWFHLDDSGRPRISSSGLIEPRVLYVWPRMVIVPMVAASSCLHCFARSFAAYAISHKQNKHILRNNSAFLLVSWLNRLSCQRFFHTFPALPLSRIPIIWFLLLCIVSHGRGASYFSSLSIAVPC